MVSDETFFAWLDGELEADEAARVEAAIAADPRLSDLAAQHRAMQARLTGAFDSVLAAPMPEPLVTAVHAPPEAEVVDFAEVKQRRQSRWNWAPQWAAMAATLAVGVVAGTFVPHQRGASPVEVAGGRMYASAGLGAALDKQLASAPAGDVRIGLTFRDQGGAICRTFTASASSGLACREGGRWQLRGMFAAPEGQGGNYRMAAGMDPNLAALVDLSMRGEAFDAAQERAARENGWR